jgi:tetratricopeptide (TPR) repeat protein
LSSDDGIPFALRRKGARVSNPGEAGLEATLRAEERHEELVEHLLARLETLTAPRARAETLVSIGEVLEGQLGDPDQGFDALVEAWRADPTCEAVLEPLEKVARAHGRWRELFAATEHLVATERDPARALALCEAMVGWLTREVPTRELALHYLERIRVMDPTHWTLHLHQAAIYEEHADFRRELDELDRAVLSAKRKDDRVRIHLMMAARYAEKRACNNALARKHYEAALALAPRSMEALRGLEALHAKTEEHALFAEVLEKEAEATEDPDERVRFLMRASEVHERHFVKPDVAANILERAFAMAPLDTDVLAALERCYSATRDWTKLVTALERAAVASEDDAVRVARLRQVAEVHELKLTDFEGARRAYERIDALVPDDEATLMELARLSEKVGDVQATVKYRTRIAERTDDPALSSRTHLSLGQLLAQGDKDPALARKHLEEAVALDPTLAQAWNVLMWMAREDGDHRRVATRPRRCTRSRRSPPSETRTSSGASSSSAPGRRSPPRSDTRTSRSRRRSRRGSFGRASSRRKRSSWRRPPACAIPSSSRA